MTYSWNVLSGNATISGSSTGQSVTLNFGGSGTATLQLIVTDGKGCKDSTQQTITINSLPSAAFTGVTSVCANSLGEVYTASVNGLTYAWSVVSGNATINGANNNQSVTLDFGGAGSATLQLIVTDGNGCKDTTQQTITINALPSAAFTGATSVCATTQGEVYTATSSGLTYTWSVLSGNASISGANNNQTVTLNFSGAGSATLQLIVSDGNTCSDTVSKTITIMPLPDVTISGASTICEKATQLTYSVPTGASAYNWNVISGNAIIVSGANSSTVTISQTGGTTNVLLQVIATSSFGCKDSATFSVSVVKKPEFTLFPAEVCYNELLQLRALLNAGATTGTFEWYYDTLLVAPVTNTATITVQDSILTINPATNATYQFFVVYRDTVSQCVSDTQSVMGSVHETPDIQGITASPPFNEIIILPDRTVQFTANVNSQPGAQNQTFTYEWSFGDGTTQTTTNNTVTHQYPDDEGTYKVSLIVYNSDQSQCVDTFQIGDVIIQFPSTLFIPNVFTPNGDGRNDGWKPQGRKVKDYTGQIWDRWGNLIWQSRDFNEEWRGVTQTGQVVPEGAYVYVVKVRFTNGKEVTRTGTVTVIR